MSQPDGHVHFGDITRLMADWFDSRDYSSVHIVCDENTRVHCLPRIQDLNWPSNPYLIEIEPGETHKTLRTCEMVWTALADQGADRSSLVINLGGGVVTDLGGFCAGTFMRGMPFVHVPTSLLGMTDAAIGGKVGVDFHHYKNYIGAFMPAVAVMIDHRFLQSLPDDQLRNGFAEVLKHALLSDVHEVSRYADAGNLETLPWQEIVKASASTKVEIVQGDLFDRGMRAALNFGHTVGHAIESFSLSTEEPLHHGEAIALGMLVEGRMSSMACDLPADQLELIESVIAMYFGDVVFPKLGLEDLWSLMRKDKKKRGNEVLFSLLGSIGDPMTGVVVPERTVNEAYLHYAKR